MDKETDKKTDQDTQKEQFLPKENVSTDGIVKEVSRVLQIEAEALISTADGLRDKSVAEELASAIRALQKSLNSGGKIVVTGVGKSGKVGQKVAATFSSTGSLAVFLHPTEGLHGDLGIVRENDVVLALSHSGNTEELIQLLPPLQSQGVQIIGVGGNPKSKLATLCNYWIGANIQQEACPHNLAPTTSTTLALAIGDALAVTLMHLRGFGRDQFAMNHPGGTLGKRLKLKVRDVMKKESELATASPTASMEEIVAVSTEKKLGGVLIVEGDRLLGLVTDGDIRRALSAKEKFFQLKAEDVMTRKPVTVTEDLPATKALEIMEKRPTQINVLPVVNTTGQCCGLVRIHDLVKDL